MSNTDTHTHTHSVPRDTKGGWCLGQGSERILTHAGVALSNQIIGLRTPGGCSGGWGEYVMSNTHTHTDTPTVSL